MKKWILLAVLIIFLSGCGKSNSENDNFGGTPTPVEQQNPGENQHGNEGQDNSGAGDNQKEVLKGYVFEYKGIKIAMDVEAASVIEALGEPLGYFEAPSCAFEGLDKTYNYGSFELDTYELNGKDYVSGIYFWDDMIETAEGVGLFMTKADMLAAYGEDYTEEFGMMVYEKDGMKLKFILTGDEITSIEYASMLLD